MCDLSMQYCGRHVRFQIALLVAIKKSICDGIKKER